MVNQGLNLATGDTWYRRSYAGPGDPNLPVEIVHCWESEAPSGRFDWYIRVRNSKRTFEMLIGSFLALYTNSACRQEQRR